MIITATAELIAGNAAAMKSCGVVQLSPSNMPPMTGPTIDPILPIPDAQPTPVERNVVGNSWQQPRSSIVGSRGQKTPPQK